MMVCPRCGSRVVWYGDTLTLHYIRRLSGGRKRYCPACQSKWIVRAAQARPMNENLVIVIILLGTVSFLFFFKLMSWFEDSSKPVSTEAASSSYSGLAQQMQQGMGKNPQSLFDSAGPDKQKMIEEAMRRMKP